MWLIETKTGQFRWVEDPRRVHYAILSHVWAKPSHPEYVPEQTYQDLLRLQKEARADGTHPITKFSDKLQRFCRTASEDGFELGWADTCCIDKTSSSDLSEAINSMYTWYGYSGACYAFLRDVVPRNASSDGQWEAGFTRSEWFKRGWTLQELIAPPIVIFVCKVPDDEPGRGWEVLGTKYNLAGLISSVTYIDISVLTCQKPLEDIPIARRMAWMQDRGTTRLEDEAYCLMGIFGVNMQTNYGEGRYAFTRLQEAILLQSSDQTIFAWGRSHDQPLALLPSPIQLPDRALLGRTHSAIISPSFLQQYMLASSPKDFGLGPSAAKTVLLSREAFQKRLGIPIKEDVYQSFETTPHGLRMHLPILNVYRPYNHPTSPTHCAILACEDPDRGLLAVLLRSHNAPNSNEFFVGAIMKAAYQIVLSPEEPYLDASVWDHYSRVAYITWAQLKALRSSVPVSAVNTLYRQSRSLAMLPPRMSVVHIPHRPSRSAIEPESVRSLHEALCKMPHRFTVEFSRWSRAAMQTQGYRVIMPGSGRQRDELLAGSTIARVPSSRENTITISKDEPEQRRGVYLTIQVGRCSCALGQRSGVLGVSVSSLSTDALDGPLLSESPSQTRQHRLNHPIHVYSWSLAHGVEAGRVRPPFEGRGPAPPAAHPHHHRVPPGT